MPTTIWPCISSGTNGSGGPVRNAVPVASVAGAAAARSRYTGSTSSADAAGHARSPGVHDRADGVQFELERRRDAEVAAATVQRPEELGMRVLARGDLHAAREDDVDGHEVVAREAVLPLEPARATAEREAGHAGGRHAPADGRETVLLRGARRTVPT